MRRFAQYNNENYIKLSGPLKNTAGNRTLAIPATAPIAIRDLILNKQYGNGFSTSSSSQLVPTGEEATYPQLLAEVLTLDGNKTSPRFKTTGRPANIDPNKHQAYRALTIYYYDVKKDKETGCMYAKLAYENGDNQMLNIINELCN